MPVTLVGLARLDVVWKSPTIVRLVLSSRRVEEVGLEKPDGGLMAVTFRDVQEEMIA